MTGVFFDLDNTLVRRSTGVLWYKYLRKKRLVSWLDMFNAGRAYFRYRRNLLDVNKLARREVRKVEGIRERDMIEMCERWFEEMVKYHIYPRAVEVVNEHIAQGHVTAILSAATLYTVNPVKRHLNIEHGIGTQLVVENGRFTGKIVEPYCYGEGKIHWAERFAEEHGLKFEDCYFYTDSYTDLPMLEKVGIPMPVNADKMLLAESRRRGWPTTNF